MNDDFTSELLALEKALIDEKEMMYADMVRSAIDGSESARLAFLRSNELWGGPGSIADQAGIEGGRSGRKAIESVLVTLGMKQVQAKVLNERTEMWILAFHQWNNEGI